MTQNTMADLRREVAKRLRDTLHGREIDTYEKGTPELPHMLGIVTIGAISTPEAESGTLLDHNYEFWNNYYETIDTKNKVKSEVETAMHSLKEDGVFRVSTPYGDDAGILYVEVGDIDEQTNRMLTTCAECGEMIPTEPKLNQKYGKYEISFALDCPECDFDMTASQLLSLHNS